MPGSSLFALIDDIASVLDDMAGMSKVAAEKTAGVLGDDLALNAQQLAGMRPERELPVVWAVAKGSFRNKAILVPAALALSAAMPAVIAPLLMLGGDYLCYEGFEKIAHRWMHSKDDDAHHAEVVTALADPAIDLVTVEKEKIRGAIRTDFILSAEIVVIALGTVAEAAFAKRVAVVSTIAVVMTVGVYGFVAGIVKLDDAGLLLLRRQGGGVVARVQRSAGSVLVGLAPFLLKGLSVVGTIAMFMVGGGILAHGIPAVHHATQNMAHAAQKVAGIGTLLEATLPALFGAALGVLAGAITLAVVRLATAAVRLFPGRR